MLIVGIFCEFETAFDCVNHVLLSTVEFDDKLGNLRALIRSYLSDRYRPNSTNKH
jgi:hypothetical protein